MSVRTKFVLAIAGLTGYVAAGFALLAWGVWASVDPADQDMLARVGRDQAAFLVVGGVLFVGGLGFFIGRLFAAYVAPLPRLTSETRLISTANREHRLAVDRPAELAALIEAVNELAERYRVAQEDIDARVAAERAEVEEDRNRLAALMAELAVAVLVCNLDGQILLYNAAARDLLGSDTGYIGLGRSVFGVIDRELLAHAVDRIRAGAEAFHAATVTRGDQLLRVRVGPVPGASGETAGYVLTLEDMTRRAEASRFRDAALRALSEGTRAPLAAIRAAIENVLDYPDMTAAERERFAEIIREETYRLSSHVEATLADSAAYLTDRWQLEEVRGTDLLAAAARGVRAAGGVTVSTAEPGEEIWLEADVHAITRAITDLVGRLRSAHGIGQITLAFAPAGRHAALDVRWRGRYSPADETVRRWSAEAHVAELRDRHDGEVWFATDAGGPHVRLLLPRSRTEPAEQPASAGANATAMVSRPEFYDFDLFRTSTLADDAADARRLDELTYTVFDTETTGLEPSLGDEIIAIGAVRIVNGRLLRQETYEQLVDPRRSIPAISRRVHGITPAMLAGQPPIGAVLPDFARFAEGSVLIGHNVAFDLKFLALKEAATGVRLDQPVLDTLLLSPVAHPAHTDHSLEAIAFRLGVSVLGRHTALGDALLTGEIFVRLIPLLADRGVVTLGQAREAARRTQQARVSETLYKRY